MTRTVEDAMLVLQAISGPDAGDASSVPSRSTRRHGARCRIETRLHRPVDEENPQQTSIGRRWDDEELKRN